MSRYLVDVAFHFLLRNIRTEDVHGPRNTDRASWAVPAVGLQAHRSERTDPTPYPFARTAIDL